MANRRMFSLDIVDTDAFLELPPGAQALYFHLGMRADDDGFVASPKKITMLCGCCPEDLTCLKERGLLTAFASGVCALKDWRAHNYIKKDRYKPTRYQEEKQSLQLNEPPEETPGEPEPGGIPAAPETGPEETQAACGTEPETVQAASGPEATGIPTGSGLEAKGVPAGSEVETQVRLELGQEKKDRAKTAEERNRLFEAFWKAYPKKKGKASCEKWFVSHRPGAALVDTMLHALQQQRASPDWQRELGRFIPQPATWLGGKRWGDEPDALPGRDPSGPGVPRTGIPGTDPSGTGSPGPSRFKRVTL